MVFTVFVILFYYIIIIISLESFTARSNTTPYYHGAISRYEYCRQIATIIADMLSDCRRRALVVTLPILCLYLSYVAYLYPNKLSLSFEANAISTDSCRQYSAPGCCDDIRMDNPFFFEDWEKVLGILETLGRPWFASGGWGLFALRIGGYGFKAAEANAWKPLQMDEDMDITIIFNDKEDEMEKYTEISMLCEQAGGLICKKNYNASGTSVIWDASEKMHFALWGAHMNHQEDAIKILAIAGYDYNMPLSRIFPLKFGRFHDSWFRLPNDYMWVYSHLRPYTPKRLNFTVDDRQVEYGEGCLKMGYPGFLHQSFGIPRHNPIRANTDLYDKVRRYEQRMVDCAFCLERHGCASFASCFRGSN